MSSSEIKNVVFDIGNVVVRWSPLEVIRLTFGEGQAIEAKARLVFQSEIWQHLNEGKLTENEAKNQYKQVLGFTDSECERLFYYVKQTQILIHGSVDLIQRCRAAGYQVLALTDNVHEIVAYLKEKYSFWELFDGAIVSAEVGVLKPHPEIYQLLLSTYQLKASETVFIDDMSLNVKGAELLGIKAIQFEDTTQCEQSLRLLGVQLS